MIFQVHENFEKCNLLPDGYEHIPLAEIVFMIGFFAVYFIEELVDATLNPDRNQSRNEASLDKEDYKQKLDHDFDRYKYCFH